MKLNSEVFSTVQFEPQNMPNPWTYGSNSLDTLRLSHKDNNVIFIILYKHYVSNFSGLKNELPKLRFEILLIIQQFVAESIQYYVTLLLEKQKFTCIFTFYIFIERLLHFFKIDIFLVNKLVN
jgi:hypothetical protein